LKLHLGALELERWGEQIVFNRKELGLQVNVANNLEALQLGSGARALHLLHHCSLEPRVGAQRRHGPAFFNLVL
jgi:hypothetical protein